MAIAMQRATTFLAQLETECGVVRGNGRKMMGSAHQNDLRKEEQD
jgi:hypothetical protein